jgi:Trk-type K+ transport system membrane component
VSAFCNAGFGLSPDNLVPWADEPWILLTLSALIVVGGLGFAVHMDLLAMRPFSAETLRWLRWRMTESVWWPWPNRMLETPVQPRLSLNSRLVLATSGILVGLGTVLFFAAEATNGLDDASGADKLVGSLFHSVTARTAGFNALDVTRLEMPTQLLLIVLMAIGASPLSTGGGMRTTTIAVAFLSVRAMVRGRDSVEAFGRSIARPVVYACISIVAMYSVALTVLTSALLATQDLPFSHLLFESVSALSTVGLSMGVTSQLDDTGRWIVALGMIMGRVGPLAVLWSFVSRSRPLHYRYPEEQVVVA